ncbi:type II toxin-antitoxin system HigB family toxin [Chitinophaga japonensis]|uniref:mRNA interferase HigB n=1 Tax=Chitinophaga japonensis TaxID=104662 RepID=A0A562T2H5_CHIJA|nr:type II toxin-antitoxin system HigB family toxin [Chitinophaga japonensis]TWI87855.1 mRNA interferase HigB [Chitinophaga japonensis]
MVHVIKRKSISDYVKQNANAANGLWAWLALVEASTWEKPQDIVETFGAKAVDILGTWEKKVTERVVIDVKGNHLRVILKYQFHPKLKQSRMYIKWIGTHAEYDKLCELNKQYSVEMF